MLKIKIMKQALQQGFTSRSRWLLQILGLAQTELKGGYKILALLFAGFYTQCLKYHADTIDHVQ
jgi:hypothetical protein